MKRMLLLISLALALAAIVYAQEPERRPGNQQRAAPQAVTVSGTMVVANGFPALKSGEDTYLVGSINRLIGFIDGLKEGAQVTIEGFVRPLSKDGKFKYLRPEKMTFNGKNYEFAMPGFERMNRGAPGSQFWRLPPRGYPGSGLRTPPWHPNNNRPRKEAS